MFAKYRAHRERSRKVAKLRAEIAAAYRSELKGASTPSDRQIAYEIASAQMRYEENDLKVLEQAELLAKLEAAGIDVPEDYWNGEEWPLKRTLLPNGETWARRQLRTYREGRIEFYVKLVLPLASFILAVIALLEKSH